MILTWNLDQQLNLRKKTRQLQKKFSDGVISTNCDVIFIFLIFGQFGTIRKPKSGRIVCIVCNSKLLFYNNWNQSYRISNAALIVMPWVKVLFLVKKCWCFAKKCISKIKVVLALKGIFSETTYVYVLTKQIWSFEHNSNEIFYNSLCISYPIHSQTKMT